MRTWLGTAVCVCALGIGCGDDGGTADAGMGVDSAAPDSVGKADSGSNVDAGPMDAGAMDARSSDTESMDIGPDAGAPRSGVGYDPLRGAGDDPSAPNPYGGSTYYIAMDGSDEDDGLSTATAWATFRHANTQVAAGDLIYVRGGTYSEYFVLGGVGSNPREYALGTREAPITWRSYPGEYAILDGTDGPVVTGMVRFYGVTFNIFKNFEVRNGVALGVVVGQESTDNTLDNLWTHHHAGNGVAMSSSRRSRIIHVTSEENYDVITEGENADGFAVSSGGDNEFVNCLAVHNSDDGFDMWESGGNLLRNCASTRNGYGAKGNGSGFKLGGRNAGGGNLVESCVAYANLLTNFNSNTGAVGNVPNTVRNCTAYNPTDSTGRNFSMNRVAHVLRNNLAYDSPQPVRMDDMVDDESNSWNLGLTLTDDDFISLDPLELLTVFLRLALGSSAIDVGVDVGLPFSGAAPDLGAFESP